MLLPRDGFTRKYLHAQVFLHRDAFIQTTFAHRRVGTCTHRYLYTAVLLRRSAFTRTCVYTGLLLTQMSFYTQYFRVNTLKHRCSLHRQTYVQRRLFRHIYFYKKPERCFYTQVLLDQDASRKRHSYMGGWKHDLGQGSSHSGIKFPAILLLPRDAFTYKVFYTGRGLHTEMI